MPISRSKWGTLFVFSISVVKIVTNAKIQRSSFVGGHRFKDKVFACLKNVDIIPNMYVSVVEKRRFPEQTKV